MSEKNQEIIPKRVLFSNIIIGQHLVEKCNQKLIHFYIGFGWYKFIQDGISYNKRPKKADDPKRPY